VWGYPFECQETVSIGLRIEVGWSARLDISWGTAVERPTLSEQVPYAVHIHKRMTGGFVGSMTRRSHDGREPPPLTHSEDLARHRRAMWQDIVEPVFGQIIGLRESVCQRAT
jgi:hypothetical protein